MPDQAALPDADVMCDCGGNYYTAAQMREYALAYGAAVREECARICDEVSRHMLADADHDDYTFLGADVCAEAIRKD